MFYPSLNILYLAEYLTHGGLVERENECIGIGWEEGWRHEFKITEAIEFIFKKQNLP